MTVYSKKNIIPAKENAKIEPPNIYGLSKYFAEEVTRFAALHTDLKTVIIRIPGIYGGDRSSGYIYNLIQKLKKNEDIDIRTKGLEYWETMKVDDICFSLVDFIEAYAWNSQYDVFNLSYGQKTDFIETAFSLKKFLDSNSKINVHSKEYIDFYLDNKKIRTVININNNYLESLENYASTLI